MAHDAGVRIVGAAFGHDDQVEGVRFETPGTPELPFGHHELLNEKSLVFGCRLVLGSESGKERVKFGLIFVNEDGKHVSIASLSGGTADRLNGCC
jgi:hypothetical protein